MPRQPEQADSRPILRHINPLIIQDILNAWEAGQDEECVKLLPPWQAMSFVQQNVSSLIVRGTFERCLLLAYTDCDDNWSAWNQEHIKFLFDLARREKLLASGDPLPPIRAFTLYRGVAGSSRQRRVRSFSWTANPQCAAWFALRFAEMGLLNDPTVYSVSVGREYVLAYVGASFGNEEEYLIYPHAELRPSRIDPFPDPGSFNSTRRQPLQPALSHRR